MFKKLMKVIECRPKMNRKTYRQLHALTDLELRDIGICRGDIKNISMGKSVPRGGWTN